MKIITVFIAFLFVAACNEMRTNEFENYAQLAKSDLIGKGWVPTFIPKSAYDIKERHRVDVASIYVKFNFEKGDISSFESACKRISDSQYRCLHVDRKVQVDIADGVFAEIYSVRATQAE